MAYEYNPLSGQFDIVGGAAVISAAVATPADLPITLGTPAVGVTYLAQSASGTWFVNYRPAGLYRRTANLGAAADWQYLGAFPEANRDDQFRIYNAADTTKQAAFDVSAVATGTTRTYILPDWGGTVGVRTARVLGSNQAKTSDATALTSSGADQSGMSFTVVASATYRLDFHLAWTGTANGGFKAGLYCPSFMHSTGGRWGLVTYETGTTLASLNQSTSSADIITIGARTAAAAVGSGIGWTGFAVFRTGASGGTAVLRWSQNVSHSDTTTLLAGSTMIFERVA